MYDGDDDDVDERGNKNAAAVYSRPLKVPIILSLRAHAS